MLGVLAPLAYFAVLGAAFIAIAGRWALIKLRTVHKICLLAGLASLYVTWRRIFAFFAVEGERLGCGDSAFVFTCQTQSYLKSESLFVLAYLRVVEHPDAWIWSAQHLLFVVGLCLYMSTQRFKRFGSFALIAYVTVGFLAAISTMLFLFLGEDLALDIPRDRRHTANVHFVVLITSIIAVLSIIALPIAVESDRTMFVVALTILHVILPVPLFLNLPSGNVSLKLVCGVLSICCCIVNVIYIVRAGQWTPWISMFVNDCQASISYDLILSTIAVSVWLFAVDRLRGLLFLLLSLVVSPGCAFPLMIYRIESAQYSRSKSY